MTVNETPPPTMTTTVFSSSLNKNNPTRSFSLTTAAGPMDGMLTFKWRRGTTEVSLILSVYDSSGTLVASASGGDPVTLSGDLTAGSYTFEVSGSIRTSFTLEVTHPVP